MRVPRDGERPAREAPPAHREQHDGEPQRGVHGVEEGAQAGAENQHAENAPGAEKEKHPTQDEAEDGEAQHPAVGGAAGHELDPIRVREAQALDRVEPVLRVGQGGGGRLPLLHSPNHAHRL